MSVNKKELIILQRRQIHSAVKKGEYCDGLKTLLNSIDISIQYNNCVNLRKDKRIMTQPQVANQQKKRKKRKKSCNGP